MRVSTLLPILFASAALAAPLDARQRGNNRGNGRNRGGNNNQAATVTVTVTVSADCSAATGIDNAGAGNGADDASSTAVSSSVPAKTTSAPALDATPGTPTVIKVSGAKGTLEPSAVAESQKKDLTATRIATGVTIKDSDGNCLSVDITEGDFRENLIPIRPKKCDGSNAQNWDFITAGVHNDGRDGGALIVNSDMNGCMNFDDRRAAGDQVIMFSCGGRADGVSGTTNSQLFPITDLSKPYVLAPLNAKGARCFVEKNGRLDNDACDSKNPAANQQFTIGGATAAPPANTVATDASSKTEAPAITTPPPAATTQPTQTTPGVIKVSEAKGVLEPSAVAESQARDDTATRAATGVQIKDSDGNCLAVDITEGDFRENLIPVRPKKCDGSDSQKWDLITAGKHNNGRDKATLIVNSNNGCLNFDDRRAAGDQVIMFSCGGRADGDSETTNSQLFNVPTSGSTALSPLNANGARCFVEKNGRLDNEACDSKNPAANQKFTIVA